MLPVAGLMLYILAVSGDIGDRLYTSVPNPTVGPPLENGNTNIGTVVSSIDCAGMCNARPLCWWWVTYDYSPVTQSYVCMTSSLQPSMAVVPPGGQMMTGENRNILRFSYTEHLGLPKFNLTQNSPHGYFIILLIQRYFNVKFRY